MLFTEKRNIEEFIIELLNKAPLQGPLILESIQNQYGKFTKQGVYKVLRNLIDHEVVQKIDGKYHLNRYWLQKIYSFAKNHIEHSSSTDFAHVLNFEDGDNIVYRFKNPYLLDAVWLSLYDILYEHQNNNQVIIDHHPHEWMIIARPETEQYWLKRFDEDRKTVLLNISGNTILDKKFKKDWESKYRRINTGISYGLSDNQYLAILGDYVFEITLDKKFSGQIGEIFKTNENLTNDVLDIILSLSKRRFSSKLKLSKNKKKANIWRKRFEKDFHIPRISI
jgi:hypothetical protein